MGGAGRVIAITFWPSYTSERDARNRLGPAALAPCLRFPLTYIMY